MSELRQFWHEVEVIFDPEVAIEDPRLFAERERDYNPLVRIRRELQRESSRIHRKYLVCGTIGNGKTSELYHLASELAPTRMVVLVDLWRHFELTVGDPSAMDRVEPWELLGLLGLAIYRAGNERFGHRWADEPKRLEAALETLRKADNRDGPKIDLAKLAQGMVVTASGAVAGVAGVGGALAVLGAVSGATNWSWKIGMPGSRRRTDQEPEVREVINAVNKMITSLQGAYAQRLLLIVDGLDRVRDRERARVLFAESSLLRELQCDAIATSPINLLGDYALDGRGPETHMLCNVPVLKREQPGEQGPGIGFFRDLTDKRLAEVRREHPGPAAPLPDPIVARLAYYSGGLPREYVRLVRMAAGEAWEAEVEAVDDAIVDVVLREARRLKEAQMTVNEIELLESVMADPQHRRPSGELAATLIEQQRLIPYPNDTEWYYYPHPLLTLKLLEPPASTERSPG